MKILEIVFQSPIYRGSGCNSQLDCQNLLVSCLSVPYLSGKWL